MKLTLNKSIEAKQLNKRTLAPLTGSEATIPYGAILEHVGSDRDFEHFSYMGEIYRSKRDVLVSALEDGFLPGDEPAARAAMPANPAAPSDAVAAEPAAKPAVEFQALGGGISRAKVPGGWLVRCGASITFLPDAAHQWDGASLP